VGLGEITQTLGGLDWVTADERDGGRTLQEAVEAFDARVSAAILVSVFFTTA